MKKSERLFRILDILKGDNEVSLGGLAENFRVSQRTIFRDIKDLKKLGFARNLGQKNLDEKVPADAVANRLTLMELRLIRFALKTHHLAKLFPFEKLAERIELIRPEIRPKLEVDESSVESPKSRLDLGRIGKVLEEDE